METKFFADTWNFQVVEARIRKKGHTKTHYRGANFLPFNFYICERREFFFDTLDQARAYVKANRRPEFKSSRRLPIVRFT